jgi:plastocyanin
MGSNRRVGLVAAALASAVAIGLAGIASAHGPTVRVGHNSVTPGRVTIAPGATVHFRNLDAMPGGHSIVADDGSFSSPGLAKNGDWHRTFPDAGEYPFHLREHPDARGVIVVREP